MRLIERLLAQGLVLVSLAGGLGVFTYENILLLDRLAQLCPLALFSWLVLSTRINFRWIRYVLLPVAGLALFVLLYSYVFTLRTDASLLPSIFAARSYSYLLLGPVILMLYLRGWRLIDFQRIFLAAALLAVVSLLVYDLAFAPRSLLLSGSFFSVHIGQLTDEGSTIKATNTSLVFLVLYFGRRIFQVRDVPRFALMLMVLALSAVMLAIPLPRGLLASTGGALILYAALLARPQRAKLSALLLPLYALIIALSFPLLRDPFVSMLRFDQNYWSRIAESQIALSSFSEYPLFGFGQDSVYSLTYQDIFGHFYPSDIGMLGLAFQFGLVGVVLYFYLAGWLCVSLLGMVWDYTGRADPKESTFVWALFIVCLAFLVASPLQAKFIYGTGLPVGAFAWGLLLARRHSSSGVPVAEPSERRTTPAISSPGSRQPLG